VVVQGNFYDSLTRKVLPKWEAPKIQAKKSGGSLTGWDPVNVSYEAWRLCCECPEGTNVDHDLYYKLSTCYNLSMFLDLKEMASARTSWNLAVAANAEMSRMGMEMG